MDTIIDYSAGSLTPAQVRSAGHIGAIRYISPAREPWMTGKGVSRQQADAYRAAKMPWAVVWQYGAGNSVSSDVMRGRAGGLADAKAAKKALQDSGSDYLPVFFAVDFDCTLKQWNSTVVHYFRAACEALGKQRVGIYGHSRVCAWAMEDDVVARVTPTRGLCWVTRSWQFDPKAKDYCVLYQRQHNISQLGTQVDINDVLHPEWGWRAIPKAPAPKPLNVNGITPRHGRRGDPVWMADLFRAWGLKVVEMPGYKDWGVGDFGEIRGVVCHHTAGATTPASYIARNPRLGNQLSSQIHLGRDGVVTLCGVGQAWHAGAGAYGNWLPRDAGNQYTIGIEAVNAGDGSQPWTNVQMDAYRKVCAAICWYLGLHSSRVIGHKEYSSQGKIDPNFDMNVFRRDVQKLIDSANAKPAPQPQPKEPKPVTPPAPNNDVKKAVADALKPLTNDIKDIREQLTGSRGTVLKKDGTIDLDASYKGWKHILGANAKGKGLTLVDAVGALRRDVNALSVRLDDVEKLLKENK